MNDDRKLEFGRNREWIGEPLLLFVEGYSDLTFYAELLEYLGLFKHCFIQNLDGKGRKKLRNEALLLLRSDKLERMKAVAVLLDADEDSDAAFSMARDAIRDAVGLNITEPRRWFEEPESKTRLGIFIVGGSEGTGEIETLAWDSWKLESKNARLQKCVEEFTACSEATGTKLKSPDKVRIGAALSVLNEDDPRLGTGARARLFNFELPPFNALRDFLLEVKPVFEGP